jgi:uncharacterized protein DUF5719
MRRSREALVLLALVALLGAGLAADGLSDGVRPAAAVNDGALFEERGEFCPPSVKKGDLESKIVAASPEHETIPVGLQPALPQTIKLPADRLLVRKRESAAGIDVVGYGAGVVAGSLSQFAHPLEGATAVRCAPDASATWYFAEGSSDFGYEELVLLYNPFPAEAVARVNLYTPKGLQAKANLTNIAVHDSSTTAIALNQYTRAQQSLAVSVEVTRGRVIAWRVLSVNADGVPGGIASSLGADVPALSWFFPSGEIGRGAAQRISVLNPSDQEATVTVSLVTSEGVVQPEKLVDLRVAAESVKTLAIDDYLKAEEANLGPASAVVRSINGVGVVAERTLLYDREDLRGIASEVGASSPARAWALMPASTRPTGDVVTVLNPGTDATRVSITLVRAGGDPLAPADLQDVRVGGNGRLKLPVGHFTKGEPMMALVTSDEPIVVDRFAYSTIDDDIAVVMGERVRPSAP